MYSSEKHSQYTSGDSGFVSRACSDYEDSGAYSMKVQQPAAHQPVNYDHVKDLQADFAGINDFDAATMQHQHEIARFNVSWHDDNQQQQQQQQLQQQATMNEQLMQYFVQDEDGDTQLHIGVFTAATEESIADAEAAAKISHWLIAKVAQPGLLDIRNDDYLTALHVATMHGQASLVRCLVLAGANTKIVTPSLYRPWTSRGNAAIHMACEADDCASVRALTEPLSQEELKWLAFNNKALPILGQDLEIRNYNGVTPMHVAIKRGNLEIVKQLIKVGAKVNTVDPCSGYTSIHLAINNNRRNIIEYMATYHNSCINVPTRFGMYTYEIALNVDKELANDLVRWGASPIVGESDSDSYSESESESEESIDDEPQQYSPMMICSDMYPVATGTLIIT